MGFEVFFLITNENSTQKSAQNKKESKWDFFNWQCLYKGQGDYQCVKVLFFKLCCCFYEFEMSRVIRSKAYLHRRITLRWGCFWSRKGILCLKAFLIYIYNLCIFKDKFCKILQLMPVFNNSFVLVDVDVAESGSWPSTFLPLEKNPTVAMIAISPSVLF